MNHKVKWIILALIFLLLSSTNVSARSGVFSDKQTRLNNDAVAAFKAKDYEKAIKYFKQSLKLGEFNLTYLNLGRAYAFAGRCVEALDAYDRMSVAPRAEEYDPNDLYQKLQVYRAELAQQCPGRVVLRCEPRNMEYAINNGSFQACPNKPLELPAGQYNFTVRLEGQTTVSRTEVVGLNTTYVDLKIQAKAVETLLKGESEDASTLRHANKLAAWSIFGVGAASLATGLGLLAYTETSVRNEYNETDNASPKKKDLSEKINNLTFATYALVGLGGGMIIAGSTMLIVDAVYGPQSIKEVDDNDTPSASLNFNKDSVKNV